MEKVFITGYGAISPLGLNSNETWSGLIDGKSGVDYITSFDASSFETTFAAEVKNFDPESYVGRKESKRMDRFVQLAACATLEALDNSGLVINDSTAERISVMIASGIGGTITLSDRKSVV